MSYECVGKTEHDRTGVGLCSSSTHSSRLLSDSVIIFKIIKVMNLKKGYGNRNTVVRTA